MQVSDQSLKLDTVIVLSDDALHALRIPDHAVNLPVHPSSFRKSISS